VQVLVLLVATIALGVVGLGLARTATVFALLDGTTFGVDVVQISILRTILALERGQVSHCASDIPVWLQPLTRWPLMQDEQAHFSPSITGIPGR
jgi:hypothetical protein